MDFTEWLVFHAIKRQDDIVGKFAALMNMLVDFPIGITDKEELIIFLERKEVRPDILFAARTAFADYELLLQTSALPSTAPVPYLPQHGGVK